MTAHETAVKKSQSAARAATRKGAAKASRPAATPKSTKKGARVFAGGIPKADPKVVAAFFASTGLTRKQIAEALGVSTSLVGTVQKETGDRWSLTRFEAAQPVILAVAKKIAAKAK
jgi:hypothetical protein